MSLIQMSPRALGLFDINEDLFLCPFGCWAAEPAHAKLSCPDFQQLLLEQNLRTFAGEGGGTPTILLGSRVLLPVPHWATLNLLIVHTEPEDPESGGLGVWMAQSNLIM